jgi:predicted metalloendopeptidase
MELVTLLLDREFSKELKEIVKRKTNKKGATLEDSIMHVLKEFHQFHKDVHTSVEREFEPIESLLEEAEKGITDFHGRSAKACRGLPLREDIKLLLKKYSD